MSNREILIAFKTTVTGTLAVCIDWLTLVNKLFGRLGTISVELQRLTKLNFLIAVLRVASEIDLPRWPKSEKAVIKFYFKNNRLLSRYSTI